MYAVIRTGGKQYKVSPGDRIRVEKLRAPDSTITPLLVVDGGRVTADAAALEALPVVVRVVGEGRGKKIVAGKYKNKTRYYRRWGHRQDYSEVEVASIGDTSAEEVVEDRAPGRSDEQPEELESGADGESEPDIEEEERDVED